MCQKFRKCIHKRTLKKPLHTHCKRIIDAKRIKIFFLNFLLLEKLM